jgi:beta-lactamase class A
MPDQSQQRSADRAAGMAEADGPGAVLPVMATKLAHRATGLVSIHCAPESRPTAPFVNTRPTAQHYAASTMKVAVLLAAYRSFEAGEWAADAPVLVHDSFASAAGGTFSSTNDYDSDSAVWDHLGSEVPAGWLLERMIVRSSNLATNLAIEQLGFEAVNDSWRIAGSTGCAVQRLIQDDRTGWLSNQVTAPGLSMLMRAVTSGAATTDASTAAMLEVLLANEHTSDVVAGLPAGTWVAHKNGWVEGIQHTTALIRPQDAPGYLLTVCSSTGLGREEGRALVARVARASWDDRFLIAEVSA